MKDTQRRDRVVEMYNRGVAPVEIGRTIGATSQAVVMMARRAGCAPQCPSRAKKTRRTSVQRDRDAVNREMTANKKAAGLNFNMSNKAAKRDAVFLMANIPADTRTITGQLCGDPLPGRSALDQRPPLPATRICT